MNNTFGKYRITNHFRLWLLSLALALAACSSDSHSPGTGQTDELPPNDAVSDTATDIVSAFETFLSDNGINAGAIAVNFDSTPVAASGINRDALDPAPVASLSKAITAVCTLQALDSTGTSAATPIDQLMPDLFTTYTINDARMRQITVAQLITHNSGIHTPHLSVLGAQIETMQAEQKLWQFEFIANDGLAAEPGSGFYYANANYLILGLVIEQLTGEDYESWCHSNVLAPLAIDTARLSPLWTILSSFGGWEISASDYARFVDTHFSSDKLLGENPDTFAIKVAINDDTFYGPGAAMRPTPSGYQYWHNGSFTWRSVQQSGNFGSFFASYDNGFTVSVNLNADLNDGRGEELDLRLYNAVYRL